MKTLTPVTSRIQTVTHSLGPSLLQDALCPVATMLGRRVALLVFFLGAALRAQPCAATPFQWEYTGSLNTARADHTATLLASNQVLVAGGLGPSSILASAELYDPATGNWIVTGSLNFNRYGHTATLLEDGKVLVAGGGVSFDQFAELYDPATGNWTVTGGLNTGRYHHTATLLTDGRVLVAGGLGGARGITPLATAELYDPATGTWTVTGSLHSARASHTATLLPDGRVLVTGGVDANHNLLASAELYDPATGNWIVTGSLNFNRYGHTATLLEDGKVLVAGGGVSFNQLFAELYDPATGTWTVTGSLNTGRLFHTATLLLDGRVLVAGGGGDPRARTSTELYDPATVTWTFAGRLNTGRLFHTATLLSDGRVLVAGGFDVNRFEPPVASAELYDPGSGAIQR
jgi:WD40 repeat protein